MSPSPVAFPPGPRTRAPGGSYFQFGRDPLGFLTRLAREHGPVAHFRIGPRHVYLLSEPELVREVLVVHPERFRKDRGLEVAKTLLGEGLLTSEGGVWKRQRRLAQPAFHQDRVAGYAAVMARRAAARAGAWRDGAVIDAAREMAALALEIVAETLFGAEVEGDIAAIGAALDAAVDSFRIARLPFAPLLDRLPVPSTLRVRRARATLDAIVLRMIAARRLRPGGSDLLALLVDARDAEAGPALDDQELRDAAMTIFLAGHETTANALAWTLDLLGRHPEWQARVHEEVDAVLGDRLAGAEDAPRLERTRRVLTESMRLYPPAWTVARRAIAPLELGGWLVTTGATVTMSQWVIHRLPALYPDPDRFDPDRWLPERRAALPRLAYFPFGAGPRICIGESFAWMEGVLALATIAQRWRVRAEGPPPVPAPRITLRPGGGVPIRVEHRAGARAAAAHRGRAGQAQ